MGDPTSKLMDTDKSVLERPVAAIMNSPVRTVGYDVPVATAARILSHNQIGSLVVEDEGIDGIVTESHLVTALGAEHDVDRLTVGQLMTTDVVTVGADTSVEAACDRMWSSGIKKLPVTEDGDLVGIVTTTDVTHSLAPGLDGVVLPSR